MRHHRSNLGIALRFTVWLVLAWLPAASAFSFDDDPPVYSDWSAPVNLGAPINTTFQDSGTYISKDGRTLIFTSTRPGGFGGQDLWVSERASGDDPWGVPQNLGSTINSTVDDVTASLSPDGHVLYFASARTGGFGGTDIYMSRRHSKRDNFGWEAPVNLGSAVNSATNDAGPIEFEDDDDNVTLYFHSNRPGGLGSNDIYTATLMPDETFGNVTLVAELSSPAVDAQVFLRRDGLEIFFVSTRAPAIGLQDIWVATRASVNDSWGTPVNVGASLNVPAPSFNFRPSLSFDGKTMYFSSVRPGGAGAPDVWVSTRTKIPQ